MEQLEQLLQSERQNHCFAVNTALLKAYPTLEEWSTAVVLRWLDAIGLGDYGAAFEAAGIDGKRLTEMSDLASFQTRVGMTSPSHLSLITEMLSSLKSTVKKDFRRSIENVGEISDKKIVAKKKLQQSKLDFWTPEQREVYINDPKSFKGSTVSPPLLSRRSRNGSPSTTAHTSPDYDGTRNKVRPNSSRSSMEGSRNSPRNMRPATVAGMHTTSRMSPVSARSSRSPFGSSKSIELHRTENPHPPTADAKRVDHHPSIRQTVRQTLRGRLANAKDSETKNDATRNWEKIQKTLPPVLDALREKYGPKRKVDLRAPKDRMESIMHNVRDAEARGAVEELLESWLEYSFLGRIVYGDVSSVLVNAEFHIGTCYLRQRMVKQAALHFSVARECNEKMPGDSTGVSFQPRILEGLGICETRLGNYSQGLVLLERARELNVIIHGKNHPSEASILVAKSELHSAKGDHQEALEDLRAALALKEVEVGSEHIQVAKLYQAMARVRQRQLSTIDTLLDEVCTTLNTALEVKEEFDESNRVRVDKKRNADEEAQYAQLVIDIDDMNAKYSKLKENENVAKKEALSFMVRAHKTYLSVLGDCDTTSAAAQAVWELAKDTDPDIFVEYSFARPQS